ncbi:hypothetical protein Tco_0725511 [Tanacetum coccineum]|uniref:Uncharacterized protein n=1 Tax=Tanacetum coccineum TaxID=301880 RepID=A0ABQ4YD30_9ASTR
MIFQLTIVGGFVAVGIASTPISDSDEASLTLSFTNASLSLLNSSCAVLAIFIHFLAFCFLLFPVFLIGTLASSSFTTSSFPFVIEASSMSIFYFFEVSCSSYNPCLFTLASVSMGTKLLILSAFQIQSSTLQKKASSIETISMSSDS